MTVRDVLKSSLRLIGALEPGEAGDDADLQDAMNIANDLIETWGLETIMIPSLARNTFTLTASHNPHTIGAAGELVLAKPAEVRFAGLVDTTADPDFERPLEVITIDRYHAIPEKDLASSWASKLYYENTIAATGKVYLHPVPDSALTLALYTPAVLAAFASLDDTVYMPKGYSRAFRYNLALDLAPEWNLPVLDRVALTAETSKAAITTKNIVVPELGLEVSAGRLGTNPNWWRVGE